MSLAEMMPIADEPAEYGPRNAEERQILDRLEKASALPARTYASTTDFIAFIREKVAKPATK